MLNDLFKPKMSCVSSDLLFMLLKKKLTTYNIHTEHAEDIGYSLLYGNIVIPICSPSSLHAN